MAKQGLLVCQLNSWEGKKEYEVLLYLVLMQLVFAFAVFELLGREEYLVFGLNLWEGLRRQSDDW